MSNSIKDLQRYAYYEKKADEEYKKNYNTIKNYKRNWWRHYYYEAMGDGYSPKESYKMATDLVNKQKKNDEGFILSHIKRNKKKKIPKNMINKDQIELEAMMEAYDREFNKKKRGK